MPLHGVTVIVVVSGAVLMVLGIFIGRLIKVRKRQREHGAAMEKCQT